LIRTLIETTEAKESTTFLLCREGDRTIETKQSSTVVTEDGEKRSLHVVLGKINYGGNMQVSVEKMDVSERREKRSHSKDSIQR